MVSPEELAPSEKLRRGLYSRKHPPTAQDIRAPITKSEYEVKENWAHEAPEDLPLHKSSSSFFRKILIVSLLFFVLSSAIAFFVFFGGFNIVSSNNVDIQVAGPVSVAGGQELPLEVTVQNKNNSDLEYANLTVEYPEGTRNPQDVNTDLTREHQSMGTIAAGRSQKTIVRSLLFGEEDSK